MMKEELGLIEGDKRPLDSSSSTFFGFNVIGLIRLIPFMILITIRVDSNYDAFMYSTILVALAFFLVGTVKGKIVKKSKIKSGLFTIIIGGIAAMLAYAIGYTNSIV